MPEAEKATREFLADLASRYQERNAHKLDGRYEISLMVSDDLENTYTRQFDEAFGVNAHAGEAAQYIIERFERQGRLLIIGRPGSGKTVLLITLAQYLAKKAQEDNSQPLPVIFNLDSWSSDYERFDDWVKGMLTKGYGLSPDFATQLLAEQRIIFLLDGLDELARNEATERAAEIRAECLASLDKSLHDGSMSAVICCRREQFNAMLWQTGAVPPIAAVVEVQDLTEVQIERALIRARVTSRDKFAAPHLLAALRKDRTDVYWQVLSTPFYFTTALQVFDSTKPPLIDAPDKQTLEAILIAAFTEKKLTITPNTRRFHAPHTLAWLMWLAIFLNRGERVTFELSDLQPSILKQPWQYRLFFSVIFGVCGGLVMSSFRIDTSNIFYGFIFGIIGSYMIAEDFTQVLFEPLRRWITWRNIIWQGMVTSLLFSAVFVLRLALMQDTLVRMGVAKVIGTIITAFLFMCILVPISCLIAIIVGVLIRLTIRLIVGMLGDIALSNIVTEDFAQWTLAPLRRWPTWRDIWGQGLAASVIGCTVGGGVACIVGCIIAFTNGVGYYLIVFVLAVYIILGGLVGTSIGIIIGMLLGIFRACRKIARFAKIISPYQRLRTGIIFNIFQLIVMAAVFVCLLLVFGWLSPPLPSPYIIILTFGLVGLFRTPILKHAVLRVCLTLEGAMPLRYANFLSYATDLRILERDGGQWRFRHQIMQDYFARRVHDSNSGLTQP